MADDRPISTKRGYRTLHEALEQQRVRNPSRAYACVPKGSGVEDGYREITVGEFTNAVQACAHYLQETLQETILSKDQKRTSSNRDFPTIAYVGPTDLRYAMIFFAAGLVRCKVGDKNK